ncbi:MAG: hypothetical protein ABSH22_02970 [Tepidisphaeraceae bacterium]
MRQSIAVVSIVTPSREAKTRYWSPIVGVELPIAPLTATIKSAGTGPK